MKMSILAFDLGASSGKVLVGEIKKNKLIVEEIYRFANDPVKIGTHFYWDILRLFHEMKQGLLKSKFLGFHIQSIGIDTWGLDFGLIGFHGELLGNPYHYRDKQSLGMIEKVCDIVPKEEIYFHTGIQFTEVNSIYHLYAMKCSRNPILEKAETLLMIPDLLRYFLTGEKTIEETIASTTQLYNSQSKSWVAPLINKLDLPIEIFPDIVETGTRVGSIRLSICNELHIPKIRVIAVGEHDTASAVAAIPTVEKEFAYLSCGTWSLLGTEIDTPVINRQAMEWNFTNEKGVFNTYRLLKNIMGLWLIQECKRAWERDGDFLTYDEMVDLALQSKPFRSFIDPDHEMFLNPEHMPKQIQYYCQLTNQPIPRSKNQILRCILESLALKYRFVLERIEKLTNKKFPGLYIVGGGVKNNLLCQFTSNALARPVWAGMEEATAIGNLMVQYISLGEIKDLQEGRMIIQNSFPLKTYEPLDSQLWNDAYEIFKKVIESHN